MIATPHKSVGKLGIDPILSVTVPQPPLFVNPDTHVLYAAVIAAGVVHTAKFGSVGQATVNAVPPATVNVLLHVTGVMVLKSSVAS